jgi:hypothetical protein
VLAVGAAIGAVALVVFLNASANTEDFKRRMARMQAEQRIYETQTAAMLAMAGAAESAVHSAAAGGPSGSRRQWPSEASSDGVIEGTVVETSTREN